jgi:hypothetical protein
MTRVKTLPHPLLGGRDKALISWGVGMAPQLSGEAWGSVGDCGVYSIENGNLISINCWLKPNVCDALCKSPGHNRLSFPKVGSVLRHFLGTSMPTVYFADNEHFLSCHCYSDKVQPAHNT